MAAKNNQYLEFQKFQGDFFNSVAKFKQYSQYEVSRHGYILINNIGKGYPMLSNIVFSLLCFEWKAYTSPAFLQALQQANFVNKYGSGVPQFIYWKTKKVKAEKKTKKVKKGLIFDIETRAQICSILKIDSKTFEYLQFSDRIQTLGKQIIGKQLAKVKTKSKSKRKKK